MRCAFRRDPVCYRSSAPARAGWRKAWLALVAVGPLAACGLAFAGYWTSDTLTSSGPPGLMMVESPATPTASSTPFPPQVSAQASPSDADTSAEPAIVVPEPEPARPASSPASAAVSAEPAGPTFDGRPLRKARTLTMRVTAYSPDERSCGIWADGWTASGYSVWTNGMKLVAADTRLLPFGTLVSIPGYHDGQPVQVLDRGGVIKGHRLDVLYPTHERALQWGVQNLEVTVWEFAD